MVMDTLSLGFCRCLSSTPVAHASPFVECCVVYGSGKVVILGMVSSAVEEQVHLAIAWACLRLSYIKKTLNVDAYKVALPLPPDRDLVVNISPGQAGVWKNQTLGGAIAIAVVSMMTGLHPQEGTAVAGELCGCPGGLGNVIISTESSLWHNISSVQGIDRVVLGSQTAETVRDEARKEGVLVMGVGDIASALASIITPLQKSP